MARSNLKTSTSQVLVWFLVIIVASGVVIRDRQMNATIDSLKQKVESLNAKIKQQENEIYDLGREKYALINNLAISNSPQTQNFYRGDLAELDSPLLASGSATFEDFFYKNKQIKLVTKGGLKVNDLQFGVSIFELPKNDFVVKFNSQETTNYKLLKPRTPLTSSAVLTVLDDWKTYKNNLSLSFITQSGTSFYQKENLFPQISYVGYFQAENFSYLVEIFYQSTGTEKEIPASSAIRAGAKKVADGISKK